MLAVMAAFWLREGLAGMGVSQDGHRMRMYMDPEHLVDFHLSVGWVAVVVASSSRAA